MTWINDPIEEAFVKEAPTEISTIENNNHIVKTKNQRLIHGVEPVMRSKLCPFHILSVCSAGIMAQLMKSCKKATKRILNLLTADHATTNFFSDSMSSTKRDFK